MCILLYISTGREGTGDYCTGVCDPVAWQESELLLRTPQTPPAVGGRLYSHPRFVIEWMKVLCRI